MHDPQTRAPGTRWPGLFLVAIASAAIGAMVAIAMTPRAETPSPPSIPPSLTAEVAQLEERMSRLEEQLAETPIRAAVGSSEDPITRRTAKNTAVEALETRIAVLEQQASARQETQPRVREPEPVDPEALARQIQTQQQVILDPTATPERKLEAWRVLRGHENAWNDSVVQEMVHLGQASADPEIRADVWRQADGRSTHPAMAAALLQALVSDAEADVREEAAESLENYTSRIDVQQALTHASTHDVDEGVRRYAARSLERMRRPR